MKRLLYFVVVISMFAMTNQQRTNARVTPSRAGGPSAYFRCKNGLQTHISKQCDSVNDCIDGSDEGNCPGKQKAAVGQPATFFCCTTGKAVISYQQRCDGQPDCADNSDEEGCIEFALSLASQMKEKAPASDWTPRCPTGQRCLPFEPINLPVKKGTTQRPARVTNPIRQTTAKHQAIGRGEAPIKQGTREASEPCPPPQQNPPQRQQMQAQKAPCPNQPVQQEAERDARRPQQQVQGEKSPPEQGKPCPPGQKQPPPVQQQLQTQKPPCPVQQAVQQGSGNAPLPCPPQQGQKQQEVETQKPPAVPIRQVNAPCPPSGQNQVQTQSRPYSGEAGKAPCPQAKPALVEQPVAKPNVQATVKASTKGPTPAAKKFHCRDGRDLLMEYRCDGFPDCGDGSDEENCASKAT